MTIPYLRQHFRAIPAPFIASIVQEETAEDTMASILNAEHAGADGFMIDLSFLNDNDRSTDRLRQIFTISGKPVMPLLYRTGLIIAEKMSEEQRADEMLNTMNAGAASIDVIGNLFDPDAPFELAQSPEAISAQKDLIRRIHDRGGEVLISSHMSESRSSEQVLEHLQSQSERGADIVKIIIGCNTDQEFQESIRTLILLKEKMDKPFIFLCNGKLGRLQRYVAPMMGCLLNFGIERFRPHSLGSQPTVTAAKYVLNEMMWHTEYPLK